jgi:transcriptional regulator with XRE-family HTH domain
MPSLGHSREPQGEFKALIALIKNVLKERRISYAELAKQMNLSESGLKKIFSSDDVSFGRLSQIASTLGLRLADLMNEIETKDTHQVIFSDEEQKYFLKNPDAFHFFVRLLIERKDLEEIQAEFKLSEAAAFKLLKKLDAFGWIQLLPENKIKLPPLSLVKDFGSGPLLDHIYQEWSKDTVQLLAKPENQKTGKFIIRCLRMKDSTYQEFLQRLKELEMDLLKTAIREMNVSNKNLKTMRWISMTEQTSFVQTQTALKI